MRGCPGPPSSPEVPPLYVAAGVGCSIPMAAGGATSIPPPNTPGPVGSRRWVPPPKIWVRAPVSCPGLSTPVVAGESARTRPLHHLSSAKTRSETQDHPGEVGGGAAFGKAGWKPSFFTVVLKPPGRVRGDRAVFSSQRASHHVCEQPQPILHPEHLRLQHPPGSSAPHHPFPWDQTEAESISASLVMLSGGMYGSRVRCSGPRALQTYLLLFINSWTVAGLGTCWRFADLFPSPKAKQPAEWPRGASRRLARAWPHGTVSVQASLSSARNRATSL